MPSIKMGKNSASGCIKDKSGLQVCQKSILISKNVPCSARVYHMVDDIFNTTPSNKVGKSNSGNPEEHWSVTNNEMVSESDKQMSLDQLSNLTETEHKSSTCSSEIETIFSPVLESVDFLEKEGDGVIYVAELEKEETRSSWDIQAFGISDFCISDMAFSGSPTLSNGHIDAAFPYYYESEDSSLLCDLKQDYMVLPFLEDVLDSESNLVGRHLENSKTFIDSENSNLYMANHLRPHIQDSCVNVYHSLDHQDLFDPQMYIKKQPDQPDLTCTISPTPVLNEKLYGKRITLVLDLDETLVHSTLDTGADADFKFTVFFDEKEHVVYVKQRPHLQTFLERVAELFEVVVFTASQSIYAKQILDTLDPEGRIISRRAYRESCIFSEGTFMKDLTIFGVDLARVAIVDNSPQVFRLQVNNGIPIKSWFDDPSDSALISLLPFLESLVDADDVRPLIAEKFGNKE